MWSQGARELERHSQSIHSTTFLSILYPCISEHHTRLLLRSSRDSKDAQRGIGMPIVPSHKPGLLSSATSQGPAFLSRDSYNSHPVGLQVICPLPSASSQGIAVLLALLPLRGLPGPSLPTSLGTFSIVFKISPRLQTS